MKVSYWTNGEGYWIRREWVDQCPETILITGKCQGVKGHKGEHWYYRPDGSYRWSDNKDNPKRGGCSGMTPPGHKLYVSPVDKQPEFWGNNYTDKEITDSDLIARLENDDPPEGDDAGIDRPVDMDDIPEELKGRLEE